MKKKSLIISAFILSVFLLNSCATAIKIEKYVDPYEIKTSYEKPIMDFIGYKIDTNILSTSSSTQLSAGVWAPQVNTVMSEFDQAKAIQSTKSLRQLGYTLETDNIATDKSDSYFGIYSLQELELYNSNNRYVTFVEVAQSKLDCKDNRSTQAVFSGSAGGFLGGGLSLLMLGAMFKNDKYVSDLSKVYMGSGIGFSVLGLLFLIPAMAPTKTDLQFDGLYNIYIYDTQTKSLIRKDSVPVNCHETFEGSYSYDEASKEVVRNYISKNISNELLKKYDELNKWLGSRE